PAGRHPGRRTDGQADEEAQVAAQGPDRAAGVGPDPRRAGIEDYSPDPGLVRSQASPLPDGPGAQRVADARFSNYAAGGSGAASSAAASGRTASGLTFSIVCRSSRPRITLASRAQASRRWSKTSLLLPSSHTSPSSRSFWMKPRNSALSKNSGAAGAYSRLSRCAASWHRLSSSPAPRVPGPFLASTEIAM